ncbi:MAG: flavodoxin-dependent (E)-4-hydroxy-3-methylbut-2-enyl-diphosphate synthase [Candidatus Riflebacteria bacterium]|nr:flavodoxin-dependent (E)-4-hydroxy-3-methylbut-2-enyl-diphosphate synthase [Candidatus Riflebacteria bacterium]
MINKRRESKKIYIGSVSVGGDSPVSVQTMTKTDTRDVDATVSDIKRLALAGCEIIRLAVPDMAAAEALKDIVKNSVIPVVADIHFDHQLALTSVKSGVNALRINPGNLRSREKIREVVAACKDAGIPIRIGVNAGSLDPEIRLKHGGVTAEALAESAMNEVELLEKEGFFEIKIAVKAFDIALTIAANQILAARCNYPLHIGITESGLPEEGMVRSCIGIGALLMQGIGDTIRVSLTGDSAMEVDLGRKILESTGIRKFGPVIISCPTCGRCQIPLIQIAREVRERLKEIKHSVKIAVMGCAVNGPGEASDADYGIAGGKEQGLVFRKGKIVRTLPAELLVQALIDEINSGEKK